MTESENVRFCILWSTLYLRDTKALPKLEKQS